MKKEVKPGDIIEIGGCLFVIFEISNGIMYGVDFETGQSQYTFMLGGADIEVIEKPANVEWLFMKRREYNARWVQQYRGI